MLNIFELFDPYISSIFVVKIPKYLFDLFNRYAINAQLLKPSNECNLSNPSLFVMFEKPEGLMQPVFKLKLKKA